MLLSALLNNPTLFIAVATALLLAITVHEFAHALVALWFGDDTAQAMGRVTLNPLAHLDFIGTLMLLVVGFGWGKPVPINPHRLRSAWDELWISLAGPFSNLVTAGVIALVLRLIAPGPPFNFFLGILLFYQIVLMLFNLIPIPPLDGSKILKPFLSASAFAALEQVGPFMLIALVLFGSGIGVFEGLLKITGAVFRILSGTSFSFF